MASLDSLKQRVGYFDEHQEGGNDAGSLKEPVVRKASRLINKSSSNIYLAIMLASTPTTLIEFLRLQFLVF